MGSMNARATGSFHTTPINCAQLAIPCRKFALYDYFVPTAMVLTSRNFFDSLGTEAANNIKAARLSSMNEKNHLLFLFLQLNTRKILHCLAYRGMNSYLYCNYSNYCLNIDQLSHMHSKITLCVKPATSKATPALWLNQTL